MGLNYFKSRKRLDFSPHPFDVVNILGLKRGYGNNHFLLKIYGLDKTNFECYYTCHLNYFLSSDQDAEKDFLSHVWYIVQKRIEHFERKDPFSSEHPRHLSNIGKLTEFQQHLGTRDKWNIRPNDVLLKEKDGKIAELEAHIQDLEEQLKASRGIRAPIRHTILSGFSLRHPSKPGQLNLTWIVLLGEYVIN